jgi:hypothetical protein
MTSVELVERWDKAEETVEKKRATIERHKAQAEKKLQVLQKNGWEPEKKFEYAKANNNEAYWAICEYENKLDDIISAEHKLAEAEDIAKNWKKRYETALQRELTIEREIPEAFKQARQALVDRWTQYDIEYRDKMNEYIATHDYSEYKKIYPYSEREYYRKTDEEFRKIEEREADKWLLDLYNRVKAITGEVTDCSHLYWGGKCLDGYVVGKEGRAVVDTIGAGGYNIQRFHLRVLVKAYK